MLISKFKRILGYVFSLAVALVLTGCDKLIVLSPAGDISKQENMLLYVAVGLILIVIIPVLILSVVIPWRYRASNKKAKYDPTLTHGVKIEIIWWAVPCVIVVALSIITWISTHKLDPYRPLDMKEKPVVIEAIALDWRWLFIYPEYKIATINYVEIPVNRPINFKITSDGSMNAIMIHRLGGQIYAMTGMRTKLHLVAREEGVYSGRGMNFNGEGFSNMTFNTNAVSDKEFNKWVTDVKAKASPLSAKNYEQLAKPSQDSSVKFYLVTDANLFNNVLMKYNDAAAMHMMHDNKQQNQINKQNSK